MSSWKTVTTLNECDTPGCPTDLSITRRAKKGEKDGDPVPEKEMLAAMKKLGWRTGKTYATETICPDCIAEGL